jgi:hypothetical protein
MSLSRYIENKIKIKNSNNFFLEKTTTVLNSSIFLNETLNL